MKPNVFCFKSEVAVSVNKLNNNMAKFHQQVSSLSHYITKIKDNLEVCRFYLSHYHRSHQHPHPHGPQEKKNSPAGLRRDWLTGKELSVLPYSFYFYFMPHEFLYEEILCRQDLDGNGLIYGVDFRIIPDETLPLDIRDLELEMAFRYGIELSDNFMTFNEYIETVDWHWRYYYNNPPTRYTCLGATLKELITAKNIRSSTYGVYGYDYIIDPSDPKKPSVLTESEQSLEHWKAPSKLISYDDFINTCPDPIDINDMNKRDWIVDEMGDHTVHLQKEHARISRENHKSDCEYFCVRLIGEWSVNEDLDGNGLIYGVDFKLDDNDSKKTESLKRIENRVEWHDPQYSSRTIVTYDEYINTLPEDDTLKGD